MHILTIKVSVAILIPGNVGFKNVMLIEIKIDIL